MEHAQHTEEETERFSDLAVELLSGRSIAYQVWALFYEDMLPLMGSSYPGPPPLYYASQFGLRKIVRL